VYKVTYNELIENIELLSKKILESNIKYSNIYSVPRGGVPIGILLSKLLNINLVDKDKIKKDTLIVDDLIDSGKTREKFSENDFAVIYRKNNKQVDYYVKDIDGWIEFPYENTENDEQDIITRLLEVLGENPNREGLLDTPKRVVKFYKQFLDTPEFNFTVFDSEGYDEMIIQKNIPFFSLCEHHMAPFFGKATVAYIPDKKIVGLSKLTRTVEMYSRRLQNQERITQQIADRINKELSPLGVAVVLNARHFCMEMRGVKTHDVDTTTSRLIGYFKDIPECRAEFMELMK